MKKILVVDDDKSLLIIVEMLLEHNNYIVKTTCRWQMVSKSIKTFIPDLLLIDIDLGGADGGDICRKLKKSKDTQHLPVILFSTMMPEDYCNSCNAQGFLSKPFKPSDLLEIIRHNVN